MLSPILITAPASAPVSLAEAKEHLRIDHSDSDAQISALIEAAVAHFDGWTGIGRGLELQTWEIAFDRFPAREIRLPLGPVVSVTSVKYTDTAGVEQTVASGNYEVDARPVEGWIVPASAYSWPATMETINAVRVRWQAGTGCPEPIVQAIKLHVELNYDRPSGAEYEAINRTINALVKPYQRIRI